MTDEQTLEHWAAVLRPLFPGDAKAGVVQAGDAQLQFQWPPDRLVAIFVGPLAVRDYLAAGSSRRSRADENLRAFVKDNLDCMPPGHKGTFQIVVASIDFVPMA